MLERVDRIQMAVADAGEAARAFQDLLGAEPAGHEDSDYLNARRTLLTLGSSQVELCAPRGAGVVRAHLDRWGPGLLPAGFSVASVPALRAHLIAEDVEFTNEGEQIYIEPTETAGMRVVVSPAAASGPSGWSATSTRSPTPWSRRGPRRRSATRASSSSTPRASPRSGASTSATPAPSPSSTRPGASTASRRRWADGPRSAGTRSTCATPRRRTWARSCAD